MAIQQARRRVLEKKLSPYDSTVGAGDKLIGQTLSGIGGVLKQGVKDLSAVAKIKQEEIKSQDDDVMVDAQHDTYKRGLAINNDILSKYINNPDPDAMNKELEDEFNTIIEENKDKFKSQESFNKYKNSAYSNLESLMSSNYTSARARQKALANAKQADLNNAVIDNTQKSVYDAGRNNVPFEEIQKKVVPQELIDNPNMPVDAKVKKTLAEIPLTYINGAIDKPAVNEYDEQGNLTGSGILQPQELHAPINFEKKIDTYYDNLSKKVDELDINDNQKEIYNKKIEFNKEKRKQNLNNFLGDYKNATVANFISDPTNDISDTHLFDEKIEEPVQDIGYTDEKQTPATDNEMEQFGIQQPKQTKWKQSEVNSEMKKLTQNVFVPSKVSEPTMELAPKVTQSLYIPEATNYKEKEQQAITALKNINTIQENPNISDPEKDAARTIAAKSLADTKYREQANKLLVKSQIIDAYSDLFNSKVDTAEEFKISPQENYSTGIMYSFKTKKPEEFNYSAASEQNKMKYNTVRDTYMKVLSSTANGDFNTANNEIAALPYSIAKINYGGSISDGMIDQFRVIDEMGEKDRPLFMYKGYDFEYLGMNKDGTIRARRKLK